MALGSAAMITAIDLSCMERRTAGTVREVILSLCPVLVRPHLEFFVQMLSPQYRRDMDLLECAQKLIQGMEHFSYKDKQIGRAHV